MKFKVGDRVKVVRKVSTGNCSWIGLEMNKYIGKVFTINSITLAGNFRFNGIQWTFPSESLTLYPSKGRQLLFDFME